MEYGIKELARLTGVSARTLRYYDEIGILKPSRVTEAGYRCYAQKEIDLLQQILFYRERGFALKTIQQILYDKEFDMLKAMEEHLAALEEQKAATEAMITTVKKTIRHMKGECDMTDQEKFQALKHKMVSKNETKYGKEAREKYGTEQVEAANRRMMNLTEEQFDRWQKLDTEILKKLEEGVKAGIKADSSEAGQIAKLHQEWIKISVPNYTVQIHKGIAAMYLADERFTAYYDRNVKGCAQLLHDAVQTWI